MADGHRALKGRVPGPAGDLEAKRRRIGRKTVGPLWPGLEEARVEFREGFPEGAFVETRSGLRPPEGSLRFVAGADIYTGGSAKFLGAKFALAGCSVVQFGPDGAERAVQVPLPREWPRSAVAAEMFAIAVALVILVRG